MMFDKILLMECSVCGDAYEPEDAYEPADAYAHTNVCRHGRTGKNKKAWAQIARHMDDWTMLVSQSWSKPALVEHRHAVIDLGLYVGPIKHAQWPPGWYEFVMFARKEVMHADHIFNFLLDWQRKWPEPAEDEQPGSTTPA